MKHFLGFLAVLFAAAMTHGQLANPQPEVPAFHATRPLAATKLPPILTEKQLADQGMIAPAQKESYKAAARASSVVYQMPCYCYCDRNHGHTSLRSCFEGTHAAVCETCLQEVFYAEQQSKRGWSIKMIRDAIERGDFKMIDLRKASLTH